MVPPRGRMPRTFGVPSSSGHALEGTLPAVTEADELEAELLRATGRTTARMTALSPGQSPPPVSTPTRIWILPPWIVQEGIHPSEFVQVLSTPPPLSRVPRDHDPIGDDARPRAASAAAAGGSRRRRGAPPRTGPPRPRRSLSEQPQVEDRRDGGRAVPGQLEDREVAAPQVVRGRLGGEGREHRATGHLAEGVDHRCPQHHRDRDAGGQVDRDVISTKPATMRPAASTISASARRRSSGVRRVPGRRRSSPC